jgi:hypothetical protein
MSHDGLMVKNGIQEVTSPRERLVAASARRIARDGRKQTILNYKVLVGTRIVSKRGVLSNWVGRRAFALKPQQLKPVSQQVEEDAIKAAKEFMAEYESDLRELAKL